MKLTEYELPFNTFMGGWQTDHRVIDDMLDYYKDNKDKTFRGHSYDKGTILVNPHYKDSYDLSIPAQASDWPINSYQTMLNECCMKYVRKYEDADFELSPWSILEDYQIQYYPKGGGFKVYHCERNRNINRVLVFMTYLNSCDGGTEFKNQGITIPATKGLTLIWPSEWTHTHKGVISHTSEKYIVTGWFGFNE